MKDYLVMQNIYKRYQQSNYKEKDYKKDEGKRLVLEDINLSIKKGEFTVILGASGCGKTTFLKIVAGFLTADSGVILKDGEKLTEPGPDRIMVFQEFRQLFPWKTVLDNVIFGLKAKNIAENVAERKKIAQYYIEKVELSQVSNYYPHQLSGGMKQRVALARALAADPEIMLMDEPFGSLDSQTRTNLQKLLLDIWQESQKTILFVTHDIEEAIILADRIIVMDENPGRIKRILNNKLPRPRDITNHEFGKLYKTITDI